MLLSSSDHEKQDFYNSEPEKKESNEVKWILSFLLSFLLISCTKALYDYVHGRE